MHADISLEGQDPTEKIKDGHLRFQDRLAFTRAKIHKSLSDPYELFEDEFHNLIPYSVDETACQLIENDSDAIESTSDTAEYSSNTTINISDIGREDRELMGDTSSTTDSQRHSRVIEVFLLPLAVVSDEDMDQIDGKKLKNLVRWKSKILFFDSEVQRARTWRGKLEFDDYQVQDLWRSCDAFDASRALSAGDDADLVPEPTPAGERVLEYNAKTRKHEQVEQVPRYTVTIR